MQTDGHFLADAQDEPARERNRAPLVERLVAALKHRRRTQSRLTFRRKFDPVYWADGTPWMPRRAEIEVTIAPVPSEQSGWRELFLELSSGPDQNYQYYPFSSFIYVEDRLVAICEYSTEFESSIAPLTVPIGRPFTLTILTELGDLPSNNGVDGDDRELSALLIGMQLGAVMPAPTVANAQVAPADDYYSQRLVPLVKELPRPVFVVGCYRSGTGILTWALGQHPNVWPLEETGWLRLFGSGALAGYQVGNIARRSYFELYDIPREEYMAHVGLGIDDFMHKTSLRRMRQFNLRRLAGKPVWNSDRFHEQFQVARTEFSPKNRWVDGTPENSGAITLLRMLFPAGRFIGLVRSPLEVVASLVYFGRAGGSPSGVQEAIDSWKRMTRSVLLAARAYGPGVVKIVLFERMIEEPQAAISSMFDFLGEPRFSKSTPTFNTRINSSELDESERRRVLRRLENHPAADSLTKLYASVIAHLENPWVPDVAALNELIEIETDIAARMALIVRE